MSARWLAVILTAAAFIAAPLLMSARPATPSDISATELAGRVQHSADVAWSGSVETSGALQVPDNESFATLAQMLGENTRLRVWWRSSDDWWVDRIRGTGETDLFRPQGYTIRWVFESQTATFSPVSKIRLPDASDLLVRAYSQGMRQRLGLAAALLRQPALLILDEPTDGLDPQGIQEIRRLLLRLNDAGTTIFLSSHLLAEVEQMCTRVGVLDNGRLIVQEQLDVLLQPTGLVAVRTFETHRSATLLGSSIVSVDRDRLLVRAEDPARLNAYLVSEGVRVDEIGPYRRTLEQVILDAGVQA